MTSDRESGGDDDEFYEPDDIAELHQGIVNNDLDLLRQVLESGVSPNEKFPADVNPQHDGMTPLALASALNKVEAVKLLLTYQANVNDSFASLKTTALMTSSFHGHSEIVRILLRKGADVRAVDLQGSTALGYAFGGARTIEVIHQLLKAGIDVNQKNMLGMNALLLVAGYGNDVLAKMILDAGADANSTNDFGHSALHLTVVGKRSQIKKLMSGQTGSYGLNRRNIDVALKEWARLHRDTLRGQDNELELEKVGEFMMSIGSKLDERDYISDDDNEAMKRRVEAVWRHRQDKIQAEKDKKKPGVLDNFLSCGGKRSKQAKHGLKSPTAKPFDSQDNYPGRAINSPDADRDVNQISESCSKILQMIIDSGCEIDKMEKTFGMTALDMAILLGDVESTAILVAAGGDSNHLMKMFALTDLYEALVQLDKKQVKELLTFDSDIDVNQPFSQFNITKRRGNGETDQLKSDGLTPLTVAAQLNEVEVLDIMKLLQKQGADVNKVGPGGSCPLGEACRTGNLKMVQFLVSQGADIEMRCPAYKDATPVTIAAMSGHRLIVEFLLAKDAKIDKPMSDGRSALIRAVENSDWEMVEQIFNANLHDNFYDHNSFSYDMAERYQRPDRDFDTLKRAITDEARRFADRDREESMQNNKAGRLPASVGPMVGQQNQRRQTSLDDPVPPSHGRMGRVPEVQVIPEQQRQQRPEQQKQPFRQHPPKPPSPEESSEEEEDDEEEEEQQQQQRLRQQQQQQKPKQVQQQQLQQKQQKQQKQHNPPAQPPPARPPPPPAESSSEEEEEEEEEEFSNRQQLHQPKQQQQQPKQLQQQPKQQQQQPKQQQQQPKQQQQQPKQQQQQPKQQQQMKEQQIKKPLPPERTSSEEEDDEEEEIRKPQQQQQQQRHPAAGKLAAPAAKIPQKKPESSEEEDDDDEDEDDEEEEVKPAPPVQVKKQVVPQMPVTRPPGNQAINAKPVQKQPSSEEEEESDEEEEESEEEEEVRVPPQKATPANILPSAKFENRTFQAMPNHSTAPAATKGSPPRPNNVQAKQNSSTPNRAPGPPAAASVKSPMSPSGPPPPLPSTGPPSDTPTESEEEDEESDEDFEQNHAPVVTKNNKISIPTKSTVTTTKGSGGVVTRTVVTKTVVTSNVTARNEPAKGRPHAAKVEVSDDDDEDEDDDDDEDEEEESDEDNGRARYHSTETDI